MLGQLYGAELPPKQVLVQVLPEDAEAEQVGAAHEPGLLERERVAVGAAADLERRRDDLAAAQEVARGVDAVEESSLQAAVAAGIDAVERLQVHRHVERQPVIGAVTPHSQADAGQLPPVDVHTGSVAIADGLDAVLAILLDAAVHLIDDGVLVCEVGESEGRLAAGLPSVPFTWLEFEHGGSGVFVLERPALEAAGPAVADLIRKRKDVA